ncbi:MAG: hypothetical protein PHO30_08215 [Candidatus Omnitrophica bacterium]|jgi:hypothetical protein|nr:hypothetical protein [Candidatus Omnitrophota bacterium]
MEGKIKFLNIASIIFKVLAWVSAVFFVVVSIIVLVGAGGPDAPQAASIVFILGGGIYFLILYCLAEGINLLIAIYEKTCECGNSSATHPSDALASLSKKVDRLVMLLEGKPTNK